MAAYGAAVSLLKTVSELLENPNDLQEHLQILGNGVYTLKLFLEDNREVKREFEIRIRDVIYEAQDMIDSYMSSTHDFLPPSEAEINNQSFCQGLERLLQKYGAIAEMTRAEFNHQTLDREIRNSIWKKSSEIKRLHTYPMVGRHEDFYQLKDRLMSESPELQVVPIVGIAGMGKSTLAKVLYRNQEIRGEFHICGQVTVPIEYKKRDVLLELLLDMKNLGDGFSQNSDDQVEKQVYDFLKHKKFLVLLDDIRDIVVWNDLKESLPDYNNGSRILLTSRNMDFARVVGTPHLLDRVSDEDTLTLLQKIVLDGEPYPPELVVIAKGIAESCGGLPHAAVIVGRLLRCAELNAEYWEVVLSSINTCNNYDNLIEAVVSLTYKHLPQQLKTCILYLAMFPYNYDVPAYKLLDLWIAEGFIEMDELWYTSSPVELRYATDCLSHLYKRSLVSYEILEDTPPSSKIREEVFHNFVMRTAKQEKFFLGIKKDTNCSNFLQDEYGTCDQQRRLFISENIVPFVIHNDYSSKSISNVHSLLYYGSEHQFPLPSWLKPFKQLRVLDALKIRFFHFPLEILKLLQLRYLSLIYNKKLPAEVCKFRSLKSLIVSHYLSVKHSRNPSYLPPEIWNMKELNHLQVMGSDLPQPPSNTDLLLENLLTLLDVSAHSCTLQILERTPNLLDLGIQIDLLPTDDFLSFFSHLHILKVLSVFKCVVMYPNIGSQVVPCSTPLSFPPGLSDLTLSGCAFPWKYMSVIAALRKLEILKLRNYAFQGPEWEMKKDEFPNLHTLILEDTDLKNWILPDESYFPKLRCMVIRHCYTLREIPCAIGDIPTLKVLEVNECSSSTMNSGLEIKERLSRRNGSANFYIYSSRGD